MTQTTTRQPAPERFDAQIEALQQLTGLSPFSSGDEVQEHLSALVELTQTYWHLTHPGEGKETEKHALASMLQRVVRSLEHEAERRIHPRALVDSITAIEQELCHVHWLRGKQKRDDEAMLKRLLEDTDGDN